MPNISTFIIYVLLTTLSPGPNNIMSMSNAIQVGLRRSLPFNVGVFVGFFFISAISCIFTAVLFDMIPTLKTYIAGLGAIYMMWLAWKVFNSKPGADERVQNHNTYKFTFGALMQFLNPKAILYGLTTVSTFIVPYYKSIYTQILFSIALAFIGFLGTFCWSLFGSVFQRTLSLNMKRFNMIMSLVLIYCAVSLLI